MSKVLDLVVRLRSGEECLSRNRNFELFEQPHARLALRRHLYLKRLERDLLRLGPEGMVTLHTEEAVDGGGARLVLRWEVPGIRLRRQTYLTMEEVQLLRMDPAVDRVLPRMEQPVGDAGLISWAGKRG